MLYRRGVLQQLITEYSGWVNIQLQDIIKAKVMDQYIKKSAVVAEIEKLMYGFNLESDIASTGECFNEEVADAKYQLCKLILSFINNLEVKVIDIDKEINEHAGNMP